MVQIDKKPCSSFELVYKGFRKRIHYDPVAAERIWEEHMCYEDRCKIVWKAAKEIHLDVLKWTLQPISELDEDHTCRRTKLKARELRNKEGWNLLHYVSANNDDNVHKLLSAFRLLIVWAGCSVKERNNKGETPLQQVCGMHIKRDWKGRRLYIRLLRLLIEHGADVNESVQEITPLHLVHESPWAIKFLILTAKANPDPADSFQRTPIFWSLRNVHYPAVNRIPFSVFRDRIDFRRSDYMGHSLIHYAALRAHSETVDDITAIMRRLVDAGADVNSSNSRLRTPLFFLIHRPDLIPLAKTMIDDFGANVNLCDADGYTIAHLAAIMGRLDYVTLFVPHMTHNIVTQNGQTVRSCLETYSVRSSITSELEQLLKDLETKDKVIAPRRYQQPITVWQYVTLLDQHRDLLSLYIVETFHRYRGGRTLFTDLFPHISHSAAIKNRAYSFRESIAQWNGDILSLMDIIDTHSVGIIHYEQQSSCEHEHCLIARSVYQMIQQLMEVIQRKKISHWLLQVVPMGSSADGSKILLADEYDFLVIFQRVEQGDEMLSFEENGGVVELFRMALITAMQELDAEMLATNIYHPLGFQFVDCELRRVGLNIRLTWMGDRNRFNDYRGLNISVDLTPVYRWAGWENRSGFRSLRPFNHMPSWFKRDQVIEHFRPVHNPIIIPPCATTMESRCLSHPENIYLLYSLRLLKLVAQSDYVIQDLTAPNSHILKTALFCYAKERGLPNNMVDVLHYVSAICHRVQCGDWAKEIPNFVADANISTPSTLKLELVLLLQKKYLSTHSKTSVIDSK